MSTTEEKNAAAKALQLQTELGQKVLVQRTEMKNELVRQCKDKIYEMGKNLQRTDETLKVSDYLGSFTVHAYATPMSRHILYTNIMTNGDHDCPEGIADAAIKDLKGYVMEQYGRKRPVKRSGF